MTAAKPTTTPAYFVSVRGTGAEPTWEVEWRHTRDDGTRHKLKRKVGRAWMQRDADGQWAKRRGRTPVSHLDPRSAQVAAEAVVREVEAELRDAEDAERNARLTPVTFRAVAQAWLDWLEQVKGAKPSTLRDHAYLLAEPGTAHKRGGGASAGCIMAALGDLPAAEVTTRHVETVLTEIAASGVSARTVNKHRNLLGAIYSYGCRESTFALPGNPVREADRRTEPTPSARDYYSVEQIEALARALEHGAHRDPRESAVSAEEQEAIELEDRQSAEAVRLSAYTGLRMGELRALRWRDCDFVGAKLTIRRTISAGKVLDSTKSRRTREVPLADVAIATLDRLSRRKDFTRDDDYVLCSRTGARMDDSALRRRFTRAQRAAKLPRLTWHGLRHTFGSLCAADPAMDFVTLKAAMGHARITTTERYLHARPASQAAARFSAVFARPENTRLSDAELEPATHRRPRRARQLIG